MQIITQFFNKKIFLKILYVILFTCMDSDPNFLASIDAEESELCCHFHSHPRINTSFFCRNNSAWNHRFYVVSQSEGWPEAVTEREVAFALGKIHIVKGNESAWNYLRVSHSLNYSVKGSKPVRVNSGGLLKLGFE